jgi:hypothetical protein
MGWQPLGPEELVYEMLFMCMLPPRADGRPIWTSNILQEQVLMKLPLWFRGIFKDSPPLSAEIGEQLARWAAGGDVAAQSPTATSNRATPPALTALAARFDACTTRAQRSALEAEMNADWKRIPAGDKTAITEAFKKSGERIKQLEFHAANPPPISAEEAAEIARRESALK